MRLTTRRRYAVTAMLDVAMHQHQGAVPLKDIAKRQGISLSYLEQLFAKLRRKDIVASVRGPGGGYKINKILEELTVAQVISAIDEKELSSISCSNLCSCRSGKPCLTKELWSELGNVVHEYLANISFAKLVERYK